MLGVNDVAIKQNDTQKVITNSQETVIRVEKVGSMSSIAKLIKRSIDIIGALVGCIAVLFITIGIAIAKIITREKGPIFYTQDRIGKNGKIFKIYKFRSMIENSEEILEKHLEENEEARREWQIKKKLTNDPRITKIGKFIRKTSLDEMPQAINVLKGDMSLVGPRPYLPREKDEMGIYYNYIIKCKPGMTGFWQTSGRSNVSFQERLNMDLEYYRNESLKLDIKLLFKTIFVLVKNDGAV